MAPDFFQKIAFLVSKPSELFRQVKGKENGGFWKTFLFLMTIVMVSGVLSGFSGLFYGGGYSYFSPIAFIASNLVALLYSSVVLIVLSKLFLGKNGWKETFKAVAYSATIPIFVQALPTGYFSVFLLPLNIIAFGYSIVLLAKGLIILNELSLGKAIGAIIVFVLFTLGIFAFLLFGVLIPSISGIF